jgi:DNA-binding Lrp family transcriptional regulator
MKNENYITIQGWMVNELCLTGNDLICYALIYGFTQNGEYWDKSTKYISEWLGVSTRSVMDIIKRLVDKNLLDKQYYSVNGVKFCKYRVNTTNLIPYEESSLPPYEESSQCQNNIGTNKEEKENIKRKKESAEPTTLETDHSDIGGLLNNRLNQPLDLIEFKEQEIERNQKKDEDELFLKFEEFAKEYKSLCGKHTVSGVKTLYEDFKKRHKDWQDVIPLLLPALKMEHQARTNANARNEFYPMPKNLSTYLGKQRAWEAWLDDIAKYNEKEYQPICDGISLFWNEVIKCHITPFDIESLADGYNETNRPDGAVVMWRGYKYNWNSSTKQWIKQ